MFSFLRKLIIKLFGYKYIVNIKTAEVHVVNPKVNCGLNLMKDKNKIYITQAKFDILVERKMKFNNKEVNGCCKCNPSKDTDSRFKK